MSELRDDLHATVDDFLQRVFAFCQVDAMDALVELDVSFTQARAMFVLAHTDAPMPINEIASRLGLSLAATGRNVDQLVRLGVLERHENPDDRREKLIALTATGFDVVNEQLEHKRRALRVFTDRVPAHEAEALIGALGPILAGDYLRTSTKDTTP